MPQLWRHIYLRLVHFISSQSACEVIKYYLSDERLFMIFLRLSKLDHLYGWVDCDFLSTHRYCRFLETPLILCQCKIFTLAMLRYQPRRRRVVEKWCNVRIATLFKYGSSWNYSNHKYALIMFAHLTVKIGNILPRSSKEIGFN